MLRTFAILSLAAGGVLASVTQEPPKPGTPPVTTGRQDAGQSTGQSTGQRERRSGQVSNASDTYFAKWVSIAQLNQIELSRLAQERATDLDVKRFAAKMVEDHQALLQKLAPFGVRPTRSVAADSATPGKGVGPSDRAGSAEGSSSGAQIDHIALFEELGEQCLRTARNELESKQGAEFDACYVGMMVGAHAANNDMLTVFQRHASVELKAVLADVQTKVASHSSVAKELAQRLMRKANPARKDEPALDGAEHDGVK
jgi:predicted outer membrane protein